MISRRELLLLSASTAAAVYLGRITDAFAGASNRIIAGAIRWDAWYNRADASVFAQNSLAPKKYHFRAPAHCSETSETTVTCVGSQAAMDNEIRAAASGGIAYWAFDWYSPGSSLRTAWNLYQSSGNRNLVNWCGILGLDVLGPMVSNDEAWQKSVQEWIEYMQQPHYQKVTVGSTENRPLLYILWDQPNLQKHFKNDPSNVQSALHRIHALADKAGISRPYIVILDGTEGAQFALHIGADAISRYVPEFKKERHGPYTDLAMETQEYWNRLKQTGIPMVPIAMVGWDTRPRQEHPVPWEHWAKPNSNPQEYFVLPTPQELAAHTQAAVDFIRNNPSACQSKLLLIYAWDECDEGGGLIPTLGDPSGSYLQAIASILS